jgi:pimeloyl-ACP methyl ester carboxylesterase
MTADTGTTYLPARLGAHELVLLHGQPGSPADWQQVIARLPAQLHAVAADRPGYGSSRLPAGGFAANARAVLDDLDARGIERAVLVGHSYGGGVALAAASLAPGRVAAVVLLASVGPGCVNGWDRLLAAPGAGRLCALVTWRLTPWMARARLAWLARRQGRPLGPDEHVNWQVWGHVGRGHRPLWSTFLAEQRALLRELGELEHAVSSVQAPVLVLADPRDTLVPVETARRLARDLPDARLQLVQGAGHHLPRRAPDAVANAMVAFLAATEEADNRVESAAAPSEDGVALRQPAFAPTHRGPPVLQMRTAIATHHRPPGSQHATASRPRRPGSPSPGHVAMCRPRHAKRCTEAKHRRPDLLLRLRHSTWGAVFLPGR